MLSLKQLNDVCLVSSQSHDRCRYLSQDENDPNKYYCAKLSSRRTEIDEEIDDYVREMRKMGRDPRQDNLPLGDNCGGYLYFRDLLQGYDQD